MRVGRSTKDQTLRFCWNAGAGDGFDEWILFRMPATGTIGDPIRSMPRSHPAVQVAALVAVFTTGVEAKRVVVVGAGWGGLSAAHHLSSQPGVEVTVIDAAERCYCGP